MALEQTELFMVGKNLFVLFKKWSTNSAAHLVSAERMFHFRHFSRKTSFSRDLDSPMDWPKVELLAERPPFGSFSLLSRQKNHHKLFVDHFKDVCARSDNLEFLVGNPTFLTLPARYTEMFEIFPAKLQ